MREKTISENLALYEVAHDQRLRQIRRELKQAHRRYLWLRVKQFFTRRTRDAYYVIKL
jgi:hypothetical protein